MRMAPPGLTSPWCSERCKNHPVATHLQGEGQVWREALLETDRSAEIVDLEGTRLRLVEHAQDGTGGWNDIVASAWIGRLSEYTAREL
jgi:hypothetical protein